ncbi:putative golgi complex component [Phaeomoniella chlamydospora]|uniref:Conserved oligomeric Golgi complex subunit 3 n=1 Tax=Phaeomoniella chlamydospora TaxID=158046 RepID=A0A0G2GD80_PHACM|nr:putative golgi complex component [Phaeomoniella chlamydospora]
MALSKSQLEDAQILGADASLVTSDQHLKKIKAMALRSEVDLADISKDIEEELLNASLDMYQIYLDQLDASRAHLDSLLSDTAFTLDTLSELSASFKTVEAQTSAIQTQSEGLLTDQLRTEKLAGTIKDNLRYYEYLEPITRRLNAPSAGSMVRSRGFSEMLAQLDKAIDYMQTHPKHKEADTYRSRYKQLLTRALTLVRGHFINALRDIAAEVGKRIADRQLNDTTMSALLYAKFRVGAQQMKDLGLEVQKRAVPPVDADPEIEGEYQSLMNELHQNFAATRGRLIIPLVRKKLGDIAQAPSTSIDLIKYARASISYIRGICLDEFDLWGEWFHGQKGLYEWLETVCEPLYDHLRPRIIHESKLAKLCQLCILLQTRYMSDAEDENDALPDPNQLDFGLLIRPALEDTQTRIVFRTQAIVRNEIELYKPKPEDLDYPHRLHRRPSFHHSRGPVLSGRKSSNPPLLQNNALTADADISDDDDHTAAANKLFQDPSTIQRHIMYPTLTLCLTLLTRLHRLIHTNIFDDLAHQIVHQTLLSLTTASNSIAPAKTPSKAPDADQSPPFPPSASSNLFLLTHLLHLKTHLLAFDISTNTNPDISVDFSGPLSTFHELRERGGLFNPVNLMRLVANGTLLPRVVENMLDAKQELDGRLRSVINDFVGDWSTVMTSNLKSILPPNQSASTNITNKSKRGQQPSPPQTPESRASEMVSRTRTLITTLVPNLRSLLDQWINESRVKETLVAAVMESVVRTYELWFDGITASGVVSAADAAGLKKGKAREDAVWDVDAFEEWAASVFQVGSIAFADADEDGRGNGIGSDDDDVDGDARSV